MSGSGTTSIGSLALKEMTSSWSSCTISARCRVVDPTARFAWLSVKNAVGFGSPASTGRVVESWSVPQILEQLAALLFKKASEEHFHDTLMIGVTGHAMTYLSVSIICPCASVQPTRRGCQRLRPLFASSVHRSVYLSISVVKEKSSFCGGKKKTKKTRNGVTAPCGLIEEHS